MKIHVFAFNVSTKPVYHYGVIYLQSYLLLLKTTILITCVSLSHLECLSANRLQNSRALPKEVLNHSSELCVGNT